MDWFTVVETRLFQKQWPLYWSEDEFAEFVLYIAAHPAAFAKFAEFVLYIAAHPAAFAKSAGAGLAPASRLESG